MVESNMIREPERRMGREDTSNLLLFLYLVNKANEEGAIEGQKKLIKLVFLAEEEMISQGIKGLDYHFFRYHHGPFSKEVYADRDYLIENDLLADEGGFKLTDRGREVLDDLKEALKKRNIKIIDNILEKYASYPAWKLENLCDNMKVEGIKIRDLPKGETILCKLRNHQADEIYDLSSDWIETIGTRLDRGLDKSLTNALEQARLEESKSYEFRGR